MADSIANLYERALQAYPRLSRGLAYRENFGAPADGRQLELYQQGEDDSFDQSRPAIEVFSPKASPDDVAADVVSHHMVDNDPTISQAYSSLLMSMDMPQTHKLHGQYEHARRNFGEDRPYESWARTTGQPAWLRGYPFGQWPEEMYRPEQRQMLDNMKSYLRGE